jgi:3-oxoacyl-[acyl-carrier-protein] synthase-1
MSKSGRVFITGYGIITSIGKNVEENLQSLVDKRHGYGDIDFLNTAHSRDLRCCEIKLADEELREIGEAKGSHLTRTTLLGLIALREAIRSAQLTTSDVSRAGLLSSTTTGGIREFEKDFNSILDLDQHGGFEQFADTAIPGDHSERLADQVGIHNYVATLSTACSSSANAIMQGTALIRTGRLDCAICGGSEALSKFTINGFNALMILDNEHCRPFDATRRGLNLGEGAAYLVLESAERVERLGKKPLAVLSGAGNANDAYHLTASSPDGTGALKAMRLALSHANIDARDIGYVNAHGTATENNDLSEGTGLKRLFAGQLPPFSSTKPYTGHTLAAAGSIEAVYSLLALHHQMIWPSLNFNIPIPELDIRPAEDLIKGVPLRHVLSNSFGFGGNTSSLLLSAV